MSRLIRTHILQKICKQLNVREDLITRYVPLQFKSAGVDVIEVSLPGDFLSDALDTKSINTLLSLQPDQLIKNVSLGTCQKNQTFLNIGLSTDEFTKHVLTDQEECVKETPRKKIIIEYSSPNIAKPFHFGHLRSTVIGQFVANILDRSNDIVRLNYLGDWGTQFGFVMAGLDKLGISLSSISENPLVAVNRAYVLASNDDTLTDTAKSISSSMEKNKSAEALGAWRHIREMTISHLEDTYRLLGIQFDEYNWESDYVGDKWLNVLQILKSKNLTEEFDGHLVIRIGDKKVTLLKSDGTSLYLSRDIAAAIDRYTRHNCDSIKYVIDKSQANHVATVQEAVHSLLGMDIVDHVKFGRVTGMSTRMGTSVFLSDILDKAYILMSKQQEKSPNTRDRSEETTKILSVSTLIVYLLKQRRMRDFNFNWDEALQSSGDSGVKLQYTHSRLCSLERNCAIQLPATCKPEFLNHPQELELILLISRFDEVLMACEKDLESSHLVIYLFKLCNTVSRCLKNVRVKGETADVAEQRLLLFHKAKETLRQGMEIIGLKPLQAM